MNIDKIKKDIDSILASSDQNLVQENANTDGSSPMGMMGLFASLLSKEHARGLLDEKTLNAFDEGFIHIHDFDYYSSGTTTCCQLPLKKILDSGFVVGECYMRPPKSISSAMALAAILIQSNQNQQHGGQSYPNWDFDLAPFVEMSYKKNLEIISNYNANTDKAKELAWEKTIQDTYQASEAFVHNANSMLSRNGMQVPFVSINFGLDTSKYGRLVSESILKAQLAGLGDGATPLFPILVFKIKDGINTEKENVNYDLYQLALECLSKRLFPNFQFVDTPYNIEGFDIKDPSTHIATMGCRTRVYADYGKKNTTIGRGNLSFTTLNLPMIAQESKVKKIDFYQNLDNYIELVCEQLLKRMQYQKTRRLSSFKLLYGQHIWAGSDEVEEDGAIGDLLNTGTLSMGFIGLAETLKILINQHHGESNEAQELGLKIVDYMRKKMDEKTEETKLNFSLLATPAESYAGNSLRKFVEKYGIIKDISDRDYFTNSSHIPVHYNISIQDKIKKEAPYHEMENAGHILYVETDGEAAKNIEALDDIIQLMRTNNVGYGSINHPIDRCDTCGYSSIIPDSCPKCNSNNIIRIRRITGYLVGDMKKWNTAKQREECDRVKHE